MRFISFASRLTVIPPRAFRRAILRVEGKAKRDVAVRTGALRRSIHSEFHGEMHARVGSELPYARIRDQGGTITGRPWLRFKTYDGAWHTVHQVHQTGNRYLTNAGRAFPTFMSEELRRER